MEKFSADPREFFIMRDSKSSKQSLRLKVAVQIFNVYHCVQSNTSGFVL